MEKAIPSIFLILFCFACLTVNAQSIDIEEYHQEDGLPTDLIKAIEFDEKGFLWVAADGGVVKLEGNVFSPIKNIEGSSNYYKNILLTKSFGFIAASDDGLISIIDKDKKTTAEFTQNTLKYPDWPDIKYTKSLFVASDSSLWIANNIGIVHLTSSNAIPIMLPNYCHTSHYVRNHQFFELQDQLYVICQKGFIFKVDVQTNQLINIPWEHEGAEVFSALKIEQNKVLVGISSGLVQILFSENGVIKSVNKFNFPYAVSVIRLHNDKFYLGTWSQGVFEATIVDNRLNYKLIAKTENRTINDLHFDSENQLWAATNFGILLIRNLLFKREFIDFTDNYIQDIALDGEEGYFFSDGWNVGSVSFDSKECKPFYRLKDGLILQLLIKDGEVWMATDSGRIIIKKKQGVARTLDFSEQGREIFNMVEDKMGNVWFLQNRETKGIVKIDADYIVKEYINLPTHECYYTTLELNKKGELFIGGHGEEGFLFKYDYDLDSIVNISLPLHGLAKKDFGINDMVFLNSGDLVLGTSEGVWEIKGNSIKQIEFPEMNVENIASVCLDQQERIWFVNSAGLVLWDGKQTTIFNHYDGLPSTTISARNLMVDKQNNFWIGTNLGMASGQIVNKNSTSPTPIIQNIEIGFNTYSPKELHRFINDSRIKIFFTSPYYPAKLVNYAYSLSDDGDEKWKEIKTNTDYLIFEHLVPGKYIFKLKAKGNGFYNWSDTVTYEFEVYKKWYTQFWAIGLFYLLLLIFIGIYLRFLRQRNEREKKKLEGIIDQRTKALLDQNEELKILNNNINKAKESAEEAIKSKDRFFSILAHDLKSPFNTLIGFSELLANNRDQIPEESMQEVFEEMLKTSENTYKLLQNLLDWARSQTGALVIEKRLIEVSLLLQEVLDTLLPTAKQKNIKIIISQEDNLWIYADVALMATSIRNILSNAIKFSYPESTIEVLAQKEGDNWVLFKIKDSGVGIPTDKIPHLFSIENNTSSLGTASEKGTGLGLILCKEFVERCHGTLSVESQIGKGSLFILKIPAKA